MSEIRNYPPLDEILDSAELIAKKEVYSLANTKEAHKQNAKSVINLVSQHDLWKRGTSWEVYRFVSFHNQIGRVALINHAEYSGAVWDDSDESWKMLGDDELEKLNQKLDHLFNGERRAESG